MSKLRGIVWLFSLLMLATQVFAQPRLHLLKGVPQVEIPFSYVNNFIIVEVYLNAIYPYRLIFDTGAEHTIITRKDFMSFPGMTFERTFYLIGSDQSEVIPAHLVRGVRFDIPGKAAIPKFDLLMLDKNYFGFEEYTGVQVDGILSANVFSEYVFRINYQRRVITVFEPKAYHPPKVKRADKLPLEIHRGKPYVYADLQYRADTTTTNIKLLVDTGAGTSLILFNDSDSLVAPPVTNAIKGKFAMGIGGNLEGYIGRMHMLKLGKFEQHNVVNYYQAIDSLEHKTFLNKRKGLIGNHVLSRFVVDFDYAHQLMYLQAGPKYDKPYEYDRSGLTVIAGGRKHQYFYVHAVLPDSGAATVGIQPGDQIKSINRVPIGLISMDMLLRKLRNKKAQSVRIVIKRDGKKQVLRVPLRDLL